MTIPKKLRIGAHTFKIQIKDIEACGYTDRNKIIIAISDQLTQSQKESTLIHEIFHVLNNELDHALLDSLSEQLYQVIKENKFTL